MFAEYSSMGLLFGCRNSTKDFVYRDELERHLKNNVLNDLWCVFSRETVIVYMNCNLKRLQRNMSKMKF